ncbi:hypothetical protein ACLOJK_006619 [Asimina triloba]
MRRHLTTPSSSARRSSRKTLSHLIVVAAWLGCTVAVHRSPSATVPCRCPSPSGSAIRPTRQLVACWGIDRRRVCPSRATISRRLTAASALSRRLAILTVVGFGGGEDPVARCHVSCHRAVVGATSPWSDPDS